MKEMLFDSEEVYRQNIEEMLNRCNICELDSFLKILLKHFFPKTYW